MSRARSLLWALGAPARLALLALVRLYRLTLSGMVGGNCRFYPSCSQYAEQAIRNVGAVRGSALAFWRVLRCSPLSKGGVDAPPAARYVSTIQSTYDDVLHRAEVAR